MENGKKYAHGNLMTDIITEKAILGSRTGDKESEKFCCLLFDFYVLE